MITIPATTRNIGEQLSQEYASQLMQSRQALHEIISSVRFLCRQGLPLRGDGDEKEQSHAAIAHEANEDSNLAKW